MSIKDLFGRQVLSDKNKKDLASDIESTDNLKAIKTKQESFVPQVNYDNPDTFAKYGSANLYYKSALDRIINYYPYDGSDAEINTFYNKSLDIEKYIFDKKYPRTNGYINLSANGWGTSTKLNGYGVPSTLEYITFDGGPNTVNETASLSKLMPDPTNSKFQYNNVYDDNLYVNNGYPSGYGEGTRDSNLKANFNTGVTIEFWAMTGSTPAVISPLTDRQVVFDMWNNNLSSSADESYGRIRIELQNTDTSASPFLVTVQSGTLSASAKQINTASIGTTSLSSSLNGWGHYAFVFKNPTSTSFEIKLYVNGELNDTKTYTSTTIGELSAKGMQGRLGGLLTAPSFLADSTLVDNYIGGGKLSGSLDEFRFWKTARTAEQIGRNWFDQIRGGVNSDIANTTLGMYYKFNEGITGTSSIDSVVLDYGGRICNGTWTGYSSVSRNTGSAIVSASAADFEYLDPIVYDTHPSVVSLRNELEEKGLYHDRQNSTQFINLIPSWVIEEMENEGGANGDSDLEKLSHIMGAYFDKLYLQISALPSLRHEQYTSSSYKALPFAQHLPESLGLTMPELFVDANVLEKFKNRNNTELYDGDLNEAKNLIYQNLYNSLAGIFKSKGTHRSIRNVLRCFNIDDNLVYFKTYSDNQTYELNTNVKQTLKKRKRLNFNTASAAHAVMYQDADPAIPGSQGYISGGTGQPEIAGVPSPVYEATGSQDRYGFTVESSIYFPRFFNIADSYQRNFFTASLFGMQTVFTGSTGTGYAGGTTSLTGAQDIANFQVYAVRDALNSRNVRFILTSSFDPHPFDALESQTFLSTYNSENWNLSVGLRPTKKFSGFVSGSDDYGYEVIFRGYNNKLGTINNSFAVSASISSTVGKNMIRSNKRLYIGAQNTNLTGANVHPSDVEFNGLKYWTQYIDDLSLKQHSLDRENAGISGSYQNTSPFDSENTTHDVYNLNALALNWHFGTVTGSDGSGNFYSTDISSGSAFVRDNFGWNAKISGYVHPGKGHGFKADSDNVVNNELVNEYKFIDPEVVTSDDMVNVLSADDELYGLFDEVPSYVHTVEKSLYAAISEEILDYFAGAVDFNNIIGDPVHRYREDYKPLETLRNIYFEKFNNLRTVEAFTEYYKWFDDAVANIIEQLVPASANFVGDTYNIVESHVLERPKYKSQFPTIEFNAPTVDASISGIGAFLLSYQTDLFGGVEASPRPTNLHKNYWKKRAQPGGRGTGSFEIESGDADVDAQRRKFRNIMHSKPAFSGSRVILSQIDGTTYERERLLQTQLGGTVSFRNAELNRTIKGGVNFPPNKSFAFAYASTYPAGPVNTTDGVFIPENVLLGFTEDFTAIENIEQWDEEGNVGKKRHRTIGVVQGRDYDGDYTNYTNVKSNFAFPFNIMSGTIKGGADDYISERLSSSVTITNLHNDVYGDELEKPMQGPFTEYAVGGHQSRHVSLNSGSDDYTNRAEAWKILLGLRGPCPGDVWLSGAIGLVSADYPWPEANEVGETPYPMTASHKAVYYRDFVAKRPVNIRNILMRTGSTILGNYEHNYEVIHSFDTYANPRQFIETQPALPTQIFQNNSTSSTQTRTFLDLHRTDEGHYQFVDEYNTHYLTGTANKSIIATRFSTVGGALTDGTGYRDFRSNTFSPYNAINNRYLTVIKPSQGPSGSISEATGSGTTGIRVYDIHGKDYGLRSHYARHTARFGRDSLFVTAPGTSYEELPGFHKTHRNNICRIGEASTTITPILEGLTLNNDDCLLYQDETKNSTLLHTASILSSTTPETLLQAITGSGTSFSWSGWVKFGEQGSQDEETIFAIGLRQGNAPLFSLRKNYAGSTPNKYEIELYIRTNGNADGKTGTNSYTTWYWAVDEDLTDGWHHHVLTWDAIADGNLGTSNPANISAAKLYIDGTLQASATLGFDPTAQGYYNQTNGTLNVRGFTSQKRVDNEFMTLGGDCQGAGNLRALTASVDEYSFWTSELSADNVDTLYNGGIPCDIDGAITASNLPNSIWEWLRFETDQSAGRFFLDSSNPGVYSTSNRAIGYYGEVFVPLAITGAALSLDLPTNASLGFPLPGCTQTVVGYAETTTYDTEQLYDNFNIQHQIPRDTRQYAWITASLESTASWWSCGFTPARFEIRSGSTMIEPLNFVSASEAGSYIILGQRTFSAEITELGPPYNVESTFLPSVNRINYHVTDPITSSTNTLGYAASVPLTDRRSAAPFGTQYRNTDFVPARNDSGDEDLFNSLMFKRGNQYAGANWVRMRQGDHPILVNERRNNTLSTIYTGSALRHFALPPVSTKGRPVLLNMDYANSFSTSVGGYREQVENVTLQTTYNNEMIGFNEQELNTFTNINFDSEVTSFEQLVAMRARNNINLNWIVYSENLFPSARREFISSSMTRVGYDNAFWRDTIENRVTGGMGVPNSVGVEEYTDWDSVTRYITQSLWPLDAPSDFETRTAPPEVAYTTDPIFTNARYYTGSSLIYSNSAGELQNTYSFYHFTDPQPGSGVTYFFNAGQIPLVIRNAGLYSRKHMLNSPLSAFNPVGISSSTNNLVVGMEANNTRLALPSDPVAAGVTASFATGSGEAAWQAPAQAGYLTTSNGIAGFVYDSSKPWYNDYDDFRYDIKTMAKGYGVVPEFRVSEQIEKYGKVGIDGEIFDYLEIPGTNLSSSQDTFYKDYSNSDFMQNFLDIKGMSGLKASEIRLTCKAAIKFNPYKGFYPAQRTLDLVSQFSRSYADSLTFTYFSSSAGADAASISNTALMQYSYARPVMQPLFAPGIMYNSIKSGMAVDYPVVTNGYKVYKQLVTGAADGSGDYPENYMIAATISGNIKADEGGAKYISGAFWDLRVPFEAIMNPAKYLNGVELPDIEPHPQVSLPFAATASLQVQNAAEAYNRMSSNFFAEVGKFFLQGGDYTKLRSTGVDLGKKKFTGEEVYGARLRMRTSYEGSRTYEYESGSDGTNYFYSTLGAQAFFKNFTAVTIPTASPITGISGSYELPQDPEKQPSFKHNFVMYSRPTAFGPAVSGRQDLNPMSASAGAPSLATTGDHFNLSASAYGVKDSLNGYNWSFTPPYYYGEAWVDFIFRPSASVEYDLTRILAETRIVKRRYDPGSDMVDHKKVDGFYRRTLHRDQDIRFTEAGAPALGPTYGRNFTPYASENINDNAMQLDSCLNLFGIEYEQKAKTNKFGLQISKDNEQASQRWVIQPKFETPMMNFVDYTSASAPPENPPPGWTPDETEISIPQNFGSESVPRGMWHQFGRLPKTREEGIFMEIGDIPPNWLKNHYEVVTGSSIYNNYAASGDPELYKNMKSFSKLCGFDENNSSVRLGEVANKQTIREAVVAIPYLVEGLTEGETQPTTENAKTRKRFINIPTKRWKNARQEEEGSIEGDSLNTAGASIRRLAEQMERYVLPPQFDFLNNKDIDPIAMYIFEFKYELDKNDLAYIWQNLAPRNYEKATFEKDMVAHELLNTELLTEQNLLSNPNLRWMVFKVKQRGQTLYRDMITGQIDESTFQPGFAENDASGYPLLYNWPYDYISIVETINFDVDVKYDRETAKKMKSDSMRNIGAQNQILNKKRRQPGITATKLNEKQATNDVPQKGVKPKAQNKLSKRISTKYRK